VQYLLPCGFTIRHETHTHTHTCLTAPFPGLRRWAGTRKVKTNLDFTEARDSEWQWHQLGLCKSAPCSRQITTPAPHHSVFYRPDALPAAQPTASKHWRHETLLILFFLCATLRFKHQLNNLCELHCTCLFRTCVFHPCGFVLTFSVHAFSILAKCAVSYLPFPFLRFYRAMLCIRGPVSVCPSVCLPVRPSVTSRCSTKTAKRRITQTTPRDTAGTLVSWCQRSPRNSTRVTPYEGAECRWGGSKSATFDKYPAISRKQ